jgi:kynurenine formamidase
MKGAFEVEYVELSHEITTGMPVYPGLPRPKITAIADHEQSRQYYDGKAEFYLGKIELAPTRPPYIDSPFHRHPEGPDLSEVPLADVAGLPGIVVDGEIGTDGAITFRAEPSGLADRAVLVRTRWDTRWGTDAY